ncbi:MAG: hypothetical protein ACYC69_02955 [Thermodesulfovibrionales bacterium]
MKDKATISFRRTASGDVIGEIIAEDGKVLESNNFGPMADSEIKRVLAEFQSQNPDTVILPVELTGN